MNKVREPLHVCIAGSTDFVRRMSGVLRNSPNFGERTEMVVHSGVLTEAKGLVLEQRPDVFLTDIGFRTTRTDVSWLRALLQQFRERFGKDLYVIIAITTPTRFVSGGTLLFSDESSLGPSGLVDNYIIEPPPGAVTQPTIEAQLVDCLNFVVELVENSADRKFSLPSLSDDAWVPSMCDPSSRDVWMRWLPRYSRYVNENPLIVGPTGSGKTRLAAAMHSLSGRKGPFISITPRDFSSTELVQAELFGAVAGAYTGAVEKWGLVAKAEKGTLFIDELQSIDRDLQGKLITFVENKTYRRVGEAESHQADVRFVFATNRSLQELVDEGALRDDFAYRLERLQLTLHPLHERRLDISAGICFALGKILRERLQARPSAGSLDRTDTLEGLTPEAYRLLFAAYWPGNLRQLENTLAKLVEFADIRNRTLIDETSIREAMEGTLGKREISSKDIFLSAAQKMAESAQAGALTSLSEACACFSEQARLAALDVTGGDTDRAGALLSDSKKALELFVAARASQR